GRNLEFVETLAEYLRVHHQADMNAAAYACAFLMDQGFTAMEVYRIRTADVLSGVLACYGDLYDCPANAFLPQTCTDVHTEGLARSPVPPSLYPFQHQPLRWSACATGRYDGCGDILNVIGDFYVG